MSQQQICVTTLAALSAWAASNTKESYKTWVCAMKRTGRYWGADETLEDCPHE